MKNILYAIVIIGNIIIWSVALSGCNMKKDAQDDTREIIDIRKSLSTPRTFYCPSCGEKLHDRQIYDIFSKGFVCSHGHLSHWYPLGARRNPNDPSASCGKSTPKEIIIEWLTNIKYRNQLQDQLAELLAAHVYLSEGRSFNTSDLKYTYCPDCGLELAEIPSNDLYVSSMRCPNGHEWFFRGTLFRAYGTDMFIFDMTRYTYDMGYKSYFIDQSYRGFLPKQVLEAVKNLTIPPDKSVTPENNRLK